MNDDTTLLVKTHEQDGMFSRAIFSLPEPIASQGSVWVGVGYSKFRYVLTREWNRDAHPHRSLACIGLNPSKADERIGDRTVNKMVRLAKRWGYDALIMLNAGAYRATDPKDWMRAQDPFGPDNERLVIEWARRATTVMLGWGCNAKHRDAHLRMLRLLHAELPTGAKVHCMRITAKGFPEHPLYLPESLPLSVFPWIVNITKRDVVICTECGNELSKNDEVDGMVICKACSYQDFLSSRDE